MSKGLSILASWAVLAMVALPPCPAAEGFGDLPGEGKKDKKAKPAKEGEGAQENPFGNKENKPGEKGDKPREKKKKDVLGESPAFGDDLEKLDSLVGLKDDQKEKLQALKDKRDKALEKFDAANARKITKLEAALGKTQGRRDQETANLRRQVEGMLKSIETNRSRIEDGINRRMFSLLTPEQRAKWNLPILSDELTKEFSLMFLEGKQEEKLQALCKSQAKRLNIPLDPEKHAKALNGLKMQVYRSVLNKKQQVEYRKSKAPAKTERNREGVRK